MAIKLGSTVTDRITGYTGVAMSRTEFLHGCVRVRVQQPKVIDNKIPDCEHLDEVQLKENDPNTTSSLSPLLGTTDTDTVTGITGTIVSVTFYTGGQGPRAFIQPRGMTEEGKPLEGIVVDVPQLRSQQKERLKAIATANRTTGGPGDTARRHDVGRR